MASLKWVPLLTEVHLRLCSSPHKLYREQSNRVFRANKRERPLPPLHLVPFGPKLTAVWEAVERPDSRPVHASSSLAVGSWRTQGKSPRSSSHYRCVDGRLIWLAAFSRDLPDRESHLQAPMRSAASYTSLGS